MRAEWQGAINRILYSMIFTRGITDDEVASVAHSLVYFTKQEIGPDRAYQAITRALASQEDLEGLSMLPQYDRAEVERFLRALLARLDDMRPWPEPAFRGLHTSMESTFQRALPIARLDTPLMGLTNLLHWTFTPVGDAQPGRYVLLLRLRTGETVALQGNYREDKVTLLTEAAADPAETIEHFITLTGFPADKLTRIESA